MLDRRDVLKAGAFGIGAGVVRAQSDDGRTFSAGRMTGDKQPSSIETNAEGAAIFVRDGQGMQFVLLTSEIDAVTQAHIHRGGVDENGPVVVWLYPDPQAREPQLIPGRVDGILSAGRFFTGDLIGPLEGSSLDELETTIQNGNAYVNVHTEANPAGEIRGQLSAVSNARVRFRHRIDIDGENGLSTQESVDLQIQES